MLLDYIGNLQGVWLNEFAILFRRRYYLNGSHAGFIMYVNDPAHDQKDNDDMRKALKQSKGPGNFRNLFLYPPQGQKGRGADHPGLGSRGQRRVL